MATGTLITTPFGFETTAAEVVAGVDLTGKRAVGTGGASGIGVETARALAAAGADVTLAVRDTGAGDRTAADIKGTTGRAVHVARLDLADQDSVAAFAAGWSGALHILVNNAGVMAVQEPEQSPEGWDLQFATNHLGHFALATRLHGALAGAEGARVVSVSSAGHLRSPVIFDDLHFAFRPYDPWLAYGQSKTANVLFAVEADRRWADDGIRVNALMPGGIATNLQRHVGPALIENAEKNGFRLKTVEQGAATSVLLAASPHAEGVGGRYFDDCNESEVVHRRTAEAGARGVAAYAVDAANAERRWEVSEELVG